jgi:hypothetical protein
MSAKISGCIGSHLTVNPNQVKHVTNGRVEVCSDSPAISNTAGSSPPKAYEPVFRLCPPICTITSRAHLPAVAFVRAILHRSGDMLTLALAFVAGALAMLISILILVRVTER